MNPLILGTGLFFVYLLLKGEGNGSQSQGGSGTAPGGGYSGIQPGLPGGIASSSPAGTLAGYADDGTAMYTTGQVTAWGAPIFQDAQGNNYVNSGGTWQSLSGVGI
jgi:hypothetical protein